MRDVRIQVWGRVQGVGFRASARRTAERLGMTVTAENQDDGSVIMHARGTDEQLKEFTAWARRGPVAARVDDLQVK